MIRILKLKLIIYIEARNSDLRSNSYNCIPSSIYCLCFYVLHYWHCVVRLTLHHRKLCAIRCNIVNHICYIKSCPVWRLIGSICIKTICVCHEVYSCSIIQKKRSLLIPDVIWSVLQDKNIHKLSIISPKVPNF